MKVVHITTVHPCDDVRIFRKECVSLSRAGHDVVLIAPVDDSMMRRETVEDGEAVRLRPLKRQTGRTSRFTVTFLSAAKAALDERADVYHFHDPELIPLGLVLKALGYRVVYDVHEDLPRQIASKDWIAAPIRRPIALACGLVEWIATRLFDRTVAATPSIARRFPPKKTIIVQNYPHLGELASPDGAPHEARPMLVTYIGGIEGIRGARQMVEAVELVNAQLSARLALAGQVYPESFRQELIDLPGWAYVDDHGWLSRPAVRNLLGQTRVGLVLFQDAPNHRSAQPNKLFEYMSAGLPIVASAFPLWRRLVDAAGCGIVVDPADTEAIATAIHNLMSNPGEAAAMGARGLALIEEGYNWPAEAERLVSTYRELAGDRAVRS